MFRRFSLLILFISISANAIADNDYNVLIERKGSPGLDKILLNKEIILVKPIFSTQEEYIKDKGNYNIEEGLNIPEQEVLGIMIEDFLNITKYTIINHNGNVTRDFQNKEIYLSYGLFDINNNQKILPNSNHEIGIVVALLNPYRKISDVVKFPENVHTVNVTTILIDKSTFYMNKDKVKNLLANIFESGNLNEKYYW